MSTAAIPVERKTAAERLQDRDLGWGVLVALLCALTALRIAALWISPSELSFDEAQYWVWSREFAFGYFTKPPLIAWIIGAETAICGDGAFCVRAGAPLIHLASALGLGLLARRLYGPAVGFWSAIFYAIIPGVALSSLLMTTDAPLLLCWILALLVLFSHLERPATGKAVLFGVAVGIGLLVKYAMAYLPLLVLLVALVDRDARRVIFRPVSLVAVAVLLAIIAPNLVWNARNGFATFDHLGNENIAWGLDRLNATGGFAFFAGQFAVAGPVLFGVMCAALFFSLRTEHPRTDKLLLWLSFPVIAVLIVQGFLSQANANWGVVAYPAGIVLATALILRAKRSYSFYANLAICGAVSLAMIYVTGFFDPKDASGIFRQYRQAGGWSETAGNIAHVAQAEDANTLVVQGRALTAGLIYALRGDNVPVREFLAANAAPSDQFQLDRPWREGDPTAGHLFFGFSEEEAARLNLLPAAEIDAPIYSARTGRMTAWQAQGP